MGGEEATIITACRNPYAAGGGKLPKIPACDANPNDLSRNQCFACVFFFFFLRTVE